MTASSISNAAGLLDAILFAAERHKNQRRKDVEASPYINHPIALAHLIASVGRVDDLPVLQAAILHDTVEDTETTEEELRFRFGDEVADIVMEVTDDKALPKQRRKELQVEHAPQKSRGAALVKLADKTCNLRDLDLSPPTGWSVKRRQQYFDWAKQVVEALPEVNPALRAAFDVAYEKRPSAPGKRAANDRALSMPGRFKGTVGLLRWTDTGGLEIEVFDFSEQAHASFGGDIANIYTVAAQDLPKLAERLAYGFGGEVAPIEQLPESLSCFLCVESLVEWLTQNSEVPFAKRVDFDA